MRFIYVFDAESKQVLEKCGFTLIKAEPRDGVWVFLNKQDEQMNFALKKIPHTVSDVLSL